MASTILNDEYEKRTMKLLALSIDTISRQDRSVIKALIDSE